MADLGACTDELNEAIQEAEDAIEALRLGVSAAAPLGPDHALVWKKNGNEWALFVLMPNEGGYVELVKASRQLRVAAADSLPALRTALFDVHAQTTREVQEAARKVRDFVASLQQAGAASSAPCASATEGEK